MQIFSTEEDTFLLGMTAQQYVSASLELLSRAVCIIGLR